MKVQPTIPTTIDGVPLSTSAMNRTRKPSRPDPYSARYIPAPTPIGTPINAARPTMIPVPTMAFATPPPDWPAGTGFLVKKAQSIDEAPFTTRLPRMSTRASTATNERSEEHTSELQSPCNLVCRLLLEKKKKKQNNKRSVT